MLSSDDVKPQLELAIQRCRRVSCVAERGRAKGQLRRPETTQQCGAKGRKWRVLSLMRSLYDIVYTFRVAACSAWRVAVQMHTYSGSDQDMISPKLSTPPKIALCVSGQCTWSREGHCGTHQHERDPTSAAHHGLVRALLGPSAPWIISTKPLTPLSLLCDRGPSS
jgi:hypothetical protein